mgnify:CR=1 FL=1
MTGKKEQNWIDHYGFILVAFAHMTDWHLSDSEIQVIEKKMEFMISNTKQPYEKADVARKLVEIVQRYKSLSEDIEIMDTLMDACIKLKNETWFDDLAATLLLEFLAEIAEADHIIEETEIQFLKNIVI